ncbi:hypothetical protein GALL_411240 [mine drainage metagenome]|uniref:Uncharacterized protein n=1 Tax=mine drainage metagenome TaxID=410659 RepID=A0A1J5Q1N2_9ZZZZ
MQQHILQVGSGIFGEQCRIKFSLLSPQHIKLMLNHVTININVVALVDCCFAVVFNDFVLAIIGTDGLTCHITFVQPFTYRAATFGFNGCAYLIDSSFKCATVVICFVRLAIALKPAPLVNVKKCTTKFGWSECFIEPFRSQCKRVHCFQCLALTIFSGEKMIFDERTHHARFAF